MKSLVKLIGLIVVCGILVACTNANNNENQSDKNQENENNENNQNEKPETNENNQNEETENNGNNQNEGQESDDSNENQNTEQETNESESPDENEVVLENKVFQIFEPVPNLEVMDRVVVRGLAKVFEGTIQYEFEDGHFILDKGFTTASAGGPEWGEFEIVIELDDVPEGSYRIVLFEESAADGSVVHELIIPIEVHE